MRGLLLAMCLTGCAQQGIPADLHFYEDINAEVQAKCAPCHAATSPIPLTLFAGDTAEQGKNLDALAPFIADGTLIAKARHNGLSDESAARWQLWIDQGALK